VTENLVQGNFIGTNAAGTGGIGNGSGVVIEGQSGNFSSHEPVRRTRGYFNPRLVEYARYRQPSTHAWSPAKIVRLDSSILQVVSSSDFCVRPKMFAFAGDMKI
jgi:hypothetical protein